MVRQAAEPALTGGDAAWSGTGAFQPLLTRQAGRRIGNREKAFRRDVGATLGADAVLAIRHSRQRDAQTLGPLSHPRRREARQFLKLDALRDIEEVATRSLRLRHLALALQSSQEDVEMRFEQTLRRFLLHVSTATLDAWKPGMDAWLLGARPGCSGSPRSGKSAHLKDGGRMTP